jgi:NitT/TauT family transport system substrate-binding protein
MRLLSLKAASVTFAAAISFALPGLASDLIPVKFSLSFSIAADAAPYLLALERGYFRDAGLDVTIDASTGSGGFFGFRNAG